MSRTFGDLQEATEYGAHAIALLLVPALTGLTVIERSRRGTGCDYWIGIADALPFQNKARLEVSGILRGTGPQIASRIREKLEQTRVSDKSGLPVYVVVVEYSSPIVEVSRR